MKKLSINRKEINYGFVHFCKKCQHLMVNVGTDELRLTKISKNFGQNESQNHFKHSKLPKEKFICVL